MIRALLDSLRYAARTLARRPGFAATAALTLALGLGGSSALFTFVNAVLLRPLPYRDPDRLVRVTNVLPQFHAEMAGSGDYVDWRDRNRSLASIAAFSDGDSVTLVGRGERERLSAARVTASFLPTLGVVPAWGRDLLPEEDRPGGPKAVVLTDRLWRRLFSDAAPGRLVTLELDGALHAVVGVLPAAFVFPGRPEVDLLLPLALDEINDRLRGRQVIVTVVGRLGPDVSIEEAHAELKGIQAAANAGQGAGPRGAVITGDAPDLAPRGAADTASDTPLSPLQSEPVAAPPAFDLLLKVVPLQQALVADVRPALLLFSIAVGLVLAVACANVANLLLARAAARQQEMAVRAALGASRGRLVGLLIAESTLIALIGGALGLLLASGATSALVSLMPAELASALRSTGGIRLDGRVLGFALALSLLTSLLAGLLPALLASRTNPAERLRDAGPSASPGAGRRRLRGMLVGAEIALAFVLLAGTHLLVRSFQRLTALDPGFEAEQVLTVALDLDEAHHPKPEEGPVFFARLIDRIRVLPGVDYAAAGDSLPLKPFSTIMIGLEAEGRPRAREGQGPDFAVCAITPDYFRTMGITLVRGRPFAMDDRAGAAPVAIVNATLARRLWGTDDPVGQRLRFGPPEEPWVTVVGVTADVRHEELEREPRAAAYRPFAQAGRRFAFVALRGRADPAGLVASVRREVAALDPGLAVHDVATMRQRLRDAVAPRRFNTLLLGAFAGTALLLAVVGLYGALTYAVTERTRELGIRMAIGASASRIRALVLGEGLRAVGGGILVGGAAALLAGGFLRGAVFGVAPPSPATFIVVPALLLVAGLAACLVPARRATLVDPITALRAE